MGHADQECVPACPRLGLSARGGGAPPPFRSSAPHARAPAAHGELGLPSRAPPRPCRAIAHSPALHSAAPPAAPARGPANIPYSGHERDTSREPASGVTMTPSRPAPRAAPIALGARAAGAPGGRLRAVCGGMAQCASSEPAGRPAAGDTGMQARVGRPAHATTCRLRDIASYGLPAVPGIAGAAGCAAPARRCHAALGAGGTASLA